MLTAVTERVLGEFASLRADDGAGLSRLLYAAIREGINQDFSMAAEQHAEKMFGSERSERVDARIGFCPGLALFASVSRWAR